MAKKQKRSVSKGSQLSASQRQQTATAIGMTAAPAKTAASNRPSLSTEFNPDYGPVIADLKKIGIMAASFITVLVVLSFFLN